MFVYSIYSIQMVLTSEVCEYVRRHWQWLYSRSLKLSCFLSISFTLGEFFESFTVIVISNIYYLLSSEDPHNYKQIGENTNGPAATLFIYNPFRRYEVSEITISNNQLLWFQFHVVCFVFVGYYLGLAFHNIHVRSCWSHAYHDEFDNSDFLGCSTRIGSSLVACRISLFSRRFSRFNGHINCQSKDIFSWCFRWCLRIDYSTYRNDYHGKLEIFNIHSINQ